MLTEREKLWLSLAETAEDEAHQLAKTLAHEETRLLQAQQNHASMEQALDQYHHDDKVRIGQPIGGMWEIQNRRNFLAMIEKTVAALHQQVVIASTREAAARKNLYEALKKQKGFEKLAEKIRDGEQIKFNKREQKQQDEFSSRQYFDKQKD